MRLVHEETLLEELEFARRAAKHFAAEPKHTARRTHMAAPVTRTLAAVAVWLLIAGLTACEMTPPPSNPGTQPPTTEPPATQPPTTQPHPSGYTIRYEVYTNCPASVTLSTPNGGTEQYTIDPEWPWIYEIRARARDFLYISAQVRCRGGTVVTRISRWDGRAVYGDEPDWYGWRQNRSEGDFVIATTSGTF